MTVTLVDELLAICLASKGIGGELARIGACAHGAALLGHVLLRAHQIDDAKRAVRIELGGAGAGKADDVAGELAHGHLHTRANAQIRNLVLTGKLGREDLALRGALAKAAGDQMPEASPRTSETFCSSRLSPSTSWTSTWRS